jgi:hypothetical protein
MTGDITAQHGIHFKEFIISGNENSGLALMRSILIVFPEGERRYAVAGRGTRLACR